MRCADIAVIGAGPAGSAAAVTAARLGLDVVVLDRATFPRDKCCGDGLTSACLRELEALGLEPGSVASWQPVHDVVLHSPAGRRIDLRLPDGPGSFSVVARRIDLDASLVSLAVRAGAEVWEGEAVTSVDISEDGAAVVVQGTSRAVRAAVVVAADGMWSPTRKLCGAPHPRGYRGEWHAFRQYLDGAGPDARTAQHIWFPTDLLPGYVWSFPLPGGAVNVGFGFPRSGRIAVGDGAALWGELLARDEIRAVLGPDVRPAAPMRAWPIPARVDEVSLSALAGRVLFVGDAAAAPDPMTGEGIAQALQTGRLAAESIATALAAGDGARPEVALAAAASYRHAVRAELVADHRLARALSAVLASSRRTEWSLRAVDGNDWTRRNFARWMFEDYPRALLGTPRRWRRGMFHRPGAYRTATVTRPLTAAAPPADPVSR